jgi:hypothetical protein
MFVKWCQSGYRYGTFVIVAVYKPQSVIQFPSGLLTGESIVNTPVHRRLFFISCLCLVLKSCAKIQLLLSCTKVVYHVHKVLNIEQLWWWRTHVHNQLFVGTFFGRCRTHVQIIFRFKDSYLGHMLFTWTQIYVQICSKCTGTTGSQLL